MNTQKVSDELFASCLDFHRLAATAASDETRLLHLWIAMESLFRLHAGRKIDAICDCVPALMALNSFEKQVVALCEYILASVGSVRSDALLQLFPTGLDSENMKDQLLRMLLDKDEASLRLMTSIVGNNPLLYYRLSKMREYFGSSKKAADNLGAHRRNVDWQLRRIYRSRNAITHTGSKLTGTRMLVQHLHTYLVAAISAVRTEIGIAGGRWSVRQALCARSQSLTLLEAMLRDSQPVNQGALLNPRQLLVTQAEPYAWPVATEEAS
jgi:hypothetical protein